MSDDRPTTGQWEPQGWTPAGAAEPANPYAPPAHAGPGAGRPGDADAPYPETSLAQPALAQPAYGQPGSAPSGYGPPSSASPAYGPPGYGQPSPPYGPPAYGLPSSGSPAYAPPGYGQPSPAYGPPGYGQPSPAYGQAAYGLPSSGSPAYAPPAYGQGYAYGPAPVLAHWGERFLAMLIDSLIIGVPLTVAYVFAFATAVPAPGYSEPQPTAAGGFALFLGFVAYVGTWVLSRLVAQGRTGQSWGKRALGIRLVSQQTGLPVGVGKSFLREIAHNLDGFFYVGYLWPLWDTHRQTFADKVMTTVVVKD